MADHNFGIVALLAINLALAIGFYGVLSAAAILFPIVILFSNGAFMSTYAAYYKIKEIMIDPYEAEKQSDVEDAGLSEATE